VFEIDFLPVDSASSEGSTKSGDAITGRFIGSDGREKVFVIDAGFHATGEAVVNHITKYYNTTHVDLALSTHADGDHINGMPVVIDELTVDELFIHQPREHVGSEVADFANIEAVDTLINVAHDRGTRVSNPFTGEERLGGHLLLLGPDKDFYEVLLAEHLREVRTGGKAMSLSQVRSGARNLLASALAMLPFEEALTDLGVTSPRNEMSVITLLTVDGKRMLFTADAGQRALSRVITDYELRIGPFACNPLTLLQAPHHGSRRNIGPTILDRLLGTRDAPFGEVNGIVSAAHASPKHPSPKVVNALQRRGCAVTATAGGTVCYPGGAPNRPGWGPAQPLPPLDESGEIDD
jgi:beta-lactamase superfamily II metal-dependent hydrolase